MTELPDAEDALSQPPGSTPSEMFPILTSAQQARVLIHGQRRTVEKREIVVELNEHITKVFVVISGQLHILQVANNQERVVAICNPGMFTGELSVLMGRRGLVRICATEKSELIEIEREALQALVEADSELSDTFLRAFILRRLELIAREVGDIVLIGSSHSLDILRIKEFLTRNYQPYSYIDLERDAGLLAGLSDPALAHTLREIHVDVSRRWTVEQLARTAGMSRAVFAERFARKIGMPPMHYLLEWRVAVAKDMLRGEHPSLAEVAERVGYQSASAFSTAFTRLTGRSPSDFARSTD